MGDENIAIGCCMSVKVVALQLDASPSVHVHTQRCNVILKKCTFWGVEALNLTRKHEACTTGDSIISLAVLTHSLIE
jgi:hypothetical protein